jgi:hypothetical protein
MLNSTRHVIGEVNGECGWFPPPHTVTWGNWGVDSNVGDRTDGTQFTGWKWMQNKFQWNTCTQNFPRDTTAVGVYYNHDHNQNGLGDDQGSNSEYAYATAWVDLWASCPRDTNYDGICDMGGCTSTWLSSFTISNNYMDLYELDDWEPLDDYMGRLIVHSSCCTVTGISCTPRDCSSNLYSPMYPTTGYTPPSLNTTANVRMRFDWGTFIDYTGYCAYLGNWDPSYNCW